MMRHFAKSWQQRNLDSVALLSYFTSSEVDLIYLHVAVCPDALDLSVEWIPWVQPASRRKTT